MDAPVVDNQNPFYCPAMPKATFLGVIINRDQARRNGAIFQDLTPMPPSDSSGDTTMAKDMIGSDWILGQYFTSSGNNWLADSSLHDLPPYSSRASPLPRSKNDRPTHNESNMRHLHARKRRPKRKSSETFSDFDAPPKYARSIQSLHESSFDLEVRRDKLRLDGMSSPHFELGKLGSAGDQTELSATTLIDLLDKYLPGLRLRQRLSNLVPQDIATIVDFLADNDYLSKGVLNILGNTTVSKIVLTQRGAEDYIATQAGLNLPGDEIYTEFSRPGAFKDLAELSFADTTVRNFDLVHLSGLSKLAILNLDQTGISNEGVYLLIPLKHTLSKLYLANNVDIDNNAVYALMLFKRLTFLSIHDTAIDIVGVRQIAQTLEEDDHKMTLELPFICQEYLNTIDSKYFVDAAPPLIVNEYLCSQLSAATLKRNLEAHAVYNPAILASGTRPELVFRLTELLKTRKLDKLVLKMVEAQDCDKENDPFGW